MVLQIIYKEVSFLFINYFLSSLGEPLDLFIYRNKRLNENKIKLFTKQTVGKKKSYLFSKYI